MARVRSLQPTVRASSRTTTTCWPNSKRCREPVIAPGRSVIRDTTAGVELDVRVIPRARKTGPGGIREETFVLRLAAPPVEGRANDALIDWFAEALDVPRRAVRI